MRDPAMIFHDGERIAGKSFFDDIHIRQHGAESGGKYGDASLALRKISFADERADDAVSYRVHEEFERGKVYTIRECSGDLDERRTLGDNFSDNLRGDTATLERCLRGCGEFRGDGREQAAGSLRIVEQRLEFLGD